MPDPSPLGEAKDSDLENAAMDSIAGGRQVGRAKVDADEAKWAARELHEARMKRVNADTDRMRSLFRFVVGLVGTVMVTVYAAFAFYIWSEWGHIPSGSIIALIAGTVVEVIGVLAVIARYLYRTESRDDFD